MDLGNFIETTRLGLFIFSNIPASPCTHPHNTLVTMINPRQTFKLAYECYRDDFKKFISDEYSLHKDYFNRKL